MAKQYVGKNTIRQFIKNTKAGLSTKVKIFDLYDEFKAKIKVKIVSNH